MAAAALCATLAFVTPAAAATAHRTNLAEAVVAIDRGQAAIAGFRGGRTVLARLDRAGRP